MNNSNDQQTRESRHKRQKEDRLLNVLIAAVILAILIVGSVVISGNPKSPEKAAKKGQDEEVTEPKDLDEPNPMPDEQEADTEQTMSDEEEVETEETEGEETRVITDVSDGIVSQSIVDEAWEPIPTAQQGAHSSSYDRDSVDWQEKLEAISYATGLSEDGMILWKVKNGGSPQKSIGIISSKDQSEKYRVYLEWVDNEGWKPVKMDVLNTLNFDY